MQNVINNLREEFVQMKSQLTMEKNAIGQLEEVIKQVTEELRQCEEAQKELQLSCEQGVDSGGSTWNARIAGGRKQSVELKKGG
ncbi:unnamed protein product [Cylicostephanus goldi]|uniref:Uncharacterized protein n=1 Tax=Cylicostephanus goldi TaxID=71465 RepID=A0A3P7QTZ5_CYLGO|nr:unnamed protein product [Cylicostephanus goldi]